MSHPRQSPAHALPRMLSTRPQRMSLPSVRPSAGRPGAAPRTGSLESAAEHVGPKLHEFRFVEAPVSVLVEHLDQRDGPLLVDTHHVLYDLDYFLWTQHSVTILIQLGEALRYLLVSARNTSNSCSSCNSWRRGSKLHSFEESRDQNVKAKFLRSNKTCPHYNSLQ